MRGRAAARRGARLSGGGEPRETAQAPHADGVEALGVNAVKGGHALEAVGMIGSV